VSGAGDMYICTYVGSGVLVIRLGDNDNGAQYSFFLSPDLSGLCYFMGEICSEPDRGGLLFLCQEQSTDKK
jgi:hypothetical protein